jgi:hypothetical protein
MYSTRTLHQLISPFEDLATKVYSFANAKIEEKAQLYNRHEELRAFYIFLIRRNECFDKGVLALFNKLPVSLRNNMIRELDPSEASLLVDSIPYQPQQKEIIDFAFTWFPKDEYAEFVTYIENDSLRQVALDKATDQDFITNWIP